MKKTAILLAALAAALLIGNSVFANKIVRIITAPTPPVFRSLFQPVMLYNNTVDNLELLFRASVGSVSVAVEGEAGIAFYEDWQVTAGEQRSIATDGWEPGFYTLTLTLSSGAAYTWELELVEE
jgi:hypothetical protein